MNKEKRIFNKNHNHRDFLVILFWGGYFTCHNEKYDLNRRNVSERSSAPLNKFGVTINNDKVIVYEEEE